MSNGWVLPPSAACPRCGGSFQEGRKCVYCGQLVGFPVGVAVASPWLRLAGVLLETVLVFVTFFFGWLIWSLVLLPRGQTPAKQILGMRVVKLDTGRVAGAGTMLLRELIGKWVTGIVAGFTFFLIYLMIFFTPLRQELWDAMCETSVVTDDHGALAAGL